MRRRATASITALVVGVLAGAIALGGGCSIDSAGFGPDDSLDGGTFPDTASATDSSSAGADTAISPIDSMTTSDSGAPTDSSTPVDSAAPTDTATPVDTFTPVDSGSEITPIDTGGVDTAPVDTGGVDTAPVDSGVDTTPADTAIPCPETGAIRFGGHCYFYLFTPRNWDAARFACSSTTPPAHLVVITSAAEAAAINPLTGSDAWIGLNRISGSSTSKSSFTWITGEAQSYDGWATDEPNGTGDCARAVGGGPWADWTCTTPFGALCERE